MCVCWGAHTCVSSGRWGSLLIPAQRVPPHRQAGGRARPGQGSRDRGPCPVPSTLTLAAFGGRRGGVSPPEPLAFEVLPVSLRAGKLRVRKDGGWVAVTPLAWVSLCWSPGEAHLTSLLLSAAAGRTHGWEQGGTRDRIFSKWGRVPGHPERTSAWPPALPPSFGTRPGLCK